MRSFIIRYRRAFVLFAVVATLGLFSAFFSATAVSANEPFDIVVDPDAFFAGDPWFERAVRHASAEHIIPTDISRFDQLPARGQVAEVYPHRAEKIAEAGSLLARHGLRPGSNMLSALKGLTDRGTILAMTRSKKGKKRSVTQSQMRKRRAPAISPNAILSTKLWRTSPLTNVSTQSAH